MPISAPNPFLRHRLSEVRPLDDRPKDSGTNSKILPDLMEKSKPSKRLPRITARFPSPAQKFDPLETSHGPSAQREENRLEATPGEALRKEDAGVDRIPADAPFDTQPAVQPALHSAPQQAAQPALHSAPQQAAQPALHSAPQPVTHSVPQAALSPVDRFRQLNKTLPDGVQFEPLDQETLRLLKETAQPRQEDNQALQPPPRQIPQPASQSRNPSSSVPVSKKNEQIEQFMQDERNAHVFYSKLAENAPNEDIKNTIAGISESCDARMTVLGDVYKRLHGQDFTPKEAEIKTEIPFSDGVALAIFEENKSIFALTEWLDKKPDEETRNTVQNLINKKIVNYNFLTSVFTKL